MKDAEPKVPWGVHLASAGVIIALALTWFFPLLTGHVFSAVPGYEGVVYPWAAQSKGYEFYPQSDQAALNFPLQGELTATVKQGTIPWWNPDSFGGQPLFADGSSALLYPPRLFLAKTVSPTTAHDALSVFHVTLAGLFTYWLLVDLGLSPPAALLGAVSWMFGSFTLAWLQLEVVAPLFAWLPAGLLTMRRSILRSWPWSVAAAACIALLFLSTHLLFADICLVTICLYGGVLAIGELLARWRTSHSRHAFAPMARGLTGAGLGVGLAAFLLVPTAYLTSDISRQALTFADITRGMLLAPSDLRYAIWPVSLPITEEKMQWGVAFAGTLTVVCAVVGFLLRRKGSGLGRGLVVGSVLVAIGGPVSWLAYKLIPGMSIFRPYSRLLFLFDLGLAVLGAVGLDALMRAVAGPGVSLSTSSPSRVFRWYSRHTGRWWISRCMAAVVVAVTALQLGWYGRDINPPFLPRTPSSAFPVTPLIRALQSGNFGVAGWTNRVLPADNDSAGWQPPMLDSDDALVFGIASANGYDSSVPTRTVDVWRVVGGEEPSEVIATKLEGAFQPTFDALTVRYDLLPRLGVDQIAFTPATAAITSLVSTVEGLGWKRVYTGNDGSVFAWTGAPTGPLVVYNDEYVKSDGDSLSRFTSATFPYRQQVILAGAGKSSTGRSGRARVMSARQGVNSASVTVRSSRPGFLVIPDMWDPGWSATVNGVRTPVQRADFNEQAVRIPAGRSIVQLRYSPVGLAKGLVLSIASAAICVLILVLSVMAWMRRRRPTDAGDQRQYRPVSIDATAASGIREPLKHDA